MPAISMKLLAGQIRAHILQLAIYHDSDFGLDVIESSEYPLKQLVFVSLERPIFIIPTLCTGFRVRRQLVCPSLD